MDQILHDKIAQICVEHFNSLPKTGKPNKQQWTVLSCIVKENTKLNTYEVVALGTGSKCIGKACMSNKGDILNDSHAEIVCRRAFLKYIFEQIIYNKQDVFTECFTLKSTIRFHFFTSHVPCGQAAIVLENDLDKLDEPQHKRSKIDVPCIGGKLLSPLSTVRIKPGRGDPTLSVSCSDKIAKWSVMGIQGALLMLVLQEPIYLYSITVAQQTTFNMSSLSQALNKRFRGFVHTEPYCHHEMVLGQANVYFSLCKVDDKQPCPSSIIWSKTERVLEVAAEGRKQGVTKKNLYKKSGRLQICKIELFRMFLNVAAKLDLAGFLNVSGMKYHEAKMKSKEYQDVWNKVKSEVFKVWPVKDIKLLQFNAD